MSGHALVVGGTGMLRNVCLHLCALGNHVSVVARTQSHLDKLAEEGGARLHPIRSDWKDAPALRRAIEEAGRSFGRIDPAVVWIHSDSPEGPAEIVAAVRDESLPPRYFHLYGSAGDAAGSVKARWRIELPRAKGILYREILLGSRGRRWLTDDEISEGVIRALTGDRPSFLVGDAPGLPDC